MQRILVYVSKFHDATASSRTKVSMIVVANPRKIGAQTGPLVSHAQPERVCRNIARTEGTKFSGGEPSQPDELPGYFAASTIVATLEPASAVVQDMQDDIFGSVLTLKEFDDEVQAISLANATPYGLAVAVWTRLNDAAIGLSRETTAGFTWFNGSRKNSREMSCSGVDNPGCTIAGAAKETRIFGSYDPYPARQSWRIHRSAAVSSILAGPPAATGWIPSIFDQCDEAAGGILADYGIGEVARV
ncbi:aldehyde dehydrogenase family protein [Mycolicibacterium frederiksbergense]|uniref:Aldehyde dehydrogenase family protein n=1 Tax=Mycolicibacterium frederiksbergense TaxID=117567 RepID=A0A6H0S2N9_9MYCO|nr:aldehyde dehydrogenase family protein [Mycolicibacterium frederiksbergense]QIV80595.1 aldehyde dehydrogenase family protein [Mycolicibacterium frederiksbergense]